MRTVVIKGKERKAQVRDAYERVAARMNDPVLAQHVLSRWERIKDQAFPDQVQVTRGAECGRLTAAGRPCRQLKVACVAHMTDQERDERAARKARAKEPYRSYLEEAPACHSWSPPRAGEEWEIWQAGRCANCGQQSCLVVDHCHRTGLRRGFLCASCNTMEGTGSGRRWSLYRSRPPAVICGATHVYEGWRTAGPERWIVHLLGPTPTTPHGRAEYLAAAAGLRWSDHFDLFTGKPFEPPKP